LVKMSSSIIRGEGGNLLIVPGPVGPHDEPRLRQVTKEPSKRRGMKNRVQLKICGTAKKSLGRLGGNKEKASVGGSREGRKK